jgi:prepilin-type N-terminal cleavage/methylation domain-containing protein
MHMNTPITAHQIRRGFTLIELMVVIAIMIVLAAMAYGVGASAIKRARMLTDKTAAVALAEGIERYYDDYSSFPDLGGGGGADTRVESDSGLMNILLAIGPGGRAKNPKGNPYYWGRTARGSTVGRAYGGLFYSGSSSVELFDTWRKSGSLKRHYQVIMDTNYDDKIAHPFDSGKTFHHVPVLVWSTGRDGEDAPGNERDPKNHDNSYSW